MDIYQEAAVSAMKRAQGDQRLADYILDKPYWEYYWDLLNYNQYCEEVKPKNTK
jgi:hypothetical protein